MRLKECRMASSRGRVWWVTFKRVGLRQKPPLDYGIDLATGEEFGW
jgi:hypothetical protein